MICQKTELFKPMNKMIVYYLFVEIYKAMGDDESVEERA